MRSQLSLILITFLAIAVIINFSCKQTLKYEPQLTIVKTKKIGLDTSIITIPTNREKLYVYNISSTTSNGMFCGFDPVDNSLDFISLKEGKSISRIFLPKSGDNAVKNVLSIYSLSKDSTFLLTRNQIALFDSTATMLTRIPINTRRSFFKENYFLEFDYGRNFFFNSLNRKFFVTNLNATKRNESIDHFRTPFIAEIKLDKPNEIQTLLATYSQLYFENYYGFMNTPQFSISADKTAIIYNFPIEPNIYKYYIATGKTEVFGGKPLTKGMENNFIASPLDIKWNKHDDKKLLHFLENIVYYKVLPEMTGKGYFRIHSEPMQYINAKGEVNDWSKKKKYLSLFDEDLNLIGNLDLNDRNYVLQGAFTTDDGLFIPIPGLGKAIQFKHFKFNYQ